MIMAVDAVANAGLKIAGNSQAVVKIPNLVERMVGVNAAVPKGEMERIDFGERTLGPNL